MSLCACDPAQFITPVDVLESVASIELIEYKNPEQDHFYLRVLNHFDELVPFDHSKATVLELLSKEKIPDFLDSFSHTYILQGYYVYDSPKDYCIRMNLSNGNFVSIWADYQRGAFADYIGKYAQDGTVVSFWGSFSDVNDYRQLVNQYFTYNI